MNITEQPTNGQSLAGPVWVLALTQVIATAVAVFIVFLQGMQGAGCAVRCDYQTAYIANVALWIAAGVIGVVTLTCLIIWRRRRWKNWTVAVGGIAAVCTVALIANAVVSAAL